MNNINENLSKKSLSIRGKIFSGFFVMGIVSVICILIGLFFIIRAENFSAAVINNKLPLINSLIDLDNAIIKIDNIMITDDSSEVKTKSIKIYWESVDKTSAIIDGLMKHESQKSFIDNWNKLKILIQKLRNVNDKILSGSYDVSTKSLLETEFKSTANDILNILNIIDENNISSSLMDDQVNNLNLEAQKILSDIKQLEWINYSLLIVVVIFVIFITLITTKSIVPPLKNAIYIAKEIAAGRRNVKINVSSSDETGELLTALRVMQESIKNSDQKIKQSEQQARSLFEKIVASVKSFGEHSSRVASGDLRQHLILSDNKDDVMNQLAIDLNKMTDNLASIAKEITKACQDMVVMVTEVQQAISSQSSGATEQASSINEITASLSEIEKSSLQTMNKAKNLGEISERTREKGQSGLDAVDQSVQGMSMVRNKVQIIAETILDLSNQTQQIGEITAVVNNLAQQSKMLALNASIEAAKAGESGKGFAVVAIEVKNLAEQSEQATFQVQKILENIRHATEKAVMATEEGTKGVDRGTELVEQTGSIISGLNEVIHEASVASQQIEAAVRQEGAGIEQITTGMNEINKVTHSFVESVTQTTEAINHLSRIANNLKSYIDTYKL